ncbi:uncharacterized protein LOC122654086 [Telopea speciosissima]|uniref:uncharacterized protein LOC122654086 n=1 Tax=Telopea speciosissima TaxID=54955 RepID=UPI001CC6AAE7|nr:uncharacterized protein LOC122654086 [Telopea speciosissima]
MADRPQEIQVHHIHHPKHVTQGIESRYSDKGSPSTSQVIAFVTLFPIAGILLTLAGIILTITVISLALTTPLFVIFSPVLVPAAIAIGLALMGFFASGAFGITALSSLSWIINYLRETIATMPEKLEYAKRHMQKAAGHVSEKTKDVGQTIQSKAEEAAGHVSEKTKDMGQAIHRKAQEGGWTDEDGRAHEIQSHHIQHPQYVTEGIENRFRDRGGPSTTQVVAVITLFPIGGVLLTLAGIIMTITFIGLASTTPLFVIFSPVLVPAAIAIGLAMMGLLASSAFGLTAVSSLAWFFNYLRGKVADIDVPEEMEYAKLRLAEAADQVGQKTKDVGQAIQNKAHEVRRIDESGRTQESGRIQEGDRTKEGGRIQEGGRSREDGRTKEGGRT